MIHLPDPKVAVCEGRAWFRYLSFRAAFAALSRISGDIWCGGNNVLVCKFWRCIYTTSHVILFYDLFSSTLLSRAFAREHYYKLFRKSFAASIYSAFAEPSDINVLTILNTWVSSLLSCSIKFFHSKIALGRALRESWGVACATTEKHWCPVSTFACFPGKAFLSKPAKITFVENKDVNSWNKSKDCRLHNNYFAPALGGACAMGTNTMALIQKRSASTFHSGNGFMSCQRVRGWNSGLPSWHIGQISAQTWTTRAT